MVIKKIVLIDDDPVINFITKNILNSTFENINCIEFTNSTQGLDFILNNQIDILFLDINMPILSGWDILDKLVEEKREMNVFMLTSSISEKDLKMSLNYKNIKHFIHKPLSQELAKELINFEKQN
jgi:DNA-binding response OmpR family regulator